MSGVACGGLPRRVIRYVKQRREGERGRGRREGGIRCPLLSNKIAFRCHDNLPPPSPPRTPTLPSLPAGSPLPLTLSFPSSISLCLILDHNRPPNIPPPPHPHRVPTQHRAATPTRPPGEEEREGDGRERVEREQASPWKTNDAAAAATGGCPAPRYLRHGYGASPGVVGRGRRRRGGEGLREGQRVGGVGRNRRCVGGEEKVADWVGCLGGWVAGWDREAAASTPKQRRENRGGGRKGDNEAEEEDLEEEERGKKKMNGNGLWESEGRQDPGRTREGGVLPYCKRFLSRGASMGCVGRGINMRVEVQGSMDYGCSLHVAGLCGRGGGGGSVDAREECAVVMVLRGSVKVVAGDCRDNFKGFTISRVTPTAVATPLPYLRPRGGGGGGGGGGGMTNCSHEE
ncbi:hypothetical protein O3P69_015215 [Scylla paramamosain]|uniref:Uncharacterized protein n=1 Tax=Scylla paramamosain TaxID=85552 RepID=A0AAW0T351_SCYPA